MNIIPVVLIGAAIIFVVILGLTIIGRYKMCPPDRVLVIYGRTGGQSSHCINGGGKFIWPIFQNYGYMSLQPLNIKIELEDALSSQRIRVSVPSNFTIAISKKPELMQAAANRLLGKSEDDIKNLAQEIITGQMRIVIASMTIEEINSDREKLIGGISTGVEKELEKLGLELINCNITDIQDKSGYIEALGKEAASKAVNDAMIKVAEENRRGTIGKAEAERDQNIRVSQANAASAKGSNEALVIVANSEAALAKSRAEATLIAQTAQLTAAADAQRAGYAAQKEAELVRASKEEASLSATEVSRANVDKRKAVIAAEAAAAVATTEATGRMTATKSIAQGDAFAIQAKLEAEAEGQKALLRGKAEGFKTLVDAATGPVAIELIIAQQFTEIARIQGEAISKIHMDKVIVMGGGANGGGSGIGTLVSDLFKSTIPLKELADSLGLTLPSLIDIKNKPADTIPAPPSTPSK